MKAYKKAKVADRKGDLSKRWYVHYHIETAPGSGKFNRVQEFGEGYPFGSINSLHTKKERYEAAKRVRDDLNELLASGWRPGEELPAALQQELDLPLTVIEAFAQAADQLKAEGLKPGTLTMYESVTSRFLSWLDAKHPDLQLKDLTRRHIKDYLSGVRKKWSDKTHNNHRSAIARYLRAITEELELIEINPADSVRCITIRDSELYNILTEEELTKVATWCQERGEQQYWLFLQLILYMYLRPGELRLMRVRHINLKKRQITLEAEISKNDRAEPVYIPEFLAAELGQWIRGACRDHFVFTTDHRPGQKHVGVNYFRKRWLKIRRDLKLDKELKQYGMKHTGGVMLYEQTKDLLLVSGQMRHKDLNTTKRYTEQYHLKRAQRSHLDGMNSWKMKVHRNEKAG